VSSPSSFSSARARFTFATLVVLATGCSSLELGPEWRPLRRIQESQALSLGLSAGGARTIGTTVYVPNLSGFLKKNPEPKLSAVLGHERVHAVRQLEAGHAEWISRYMTDTGFMWREEMLGWYHQLEHMRRHGVRYQLEGLAKALSRYRNFAGLMISERKALEWLKQVESGVWRPQD